ncbi:hypothetical protein HDV57DRAFT_517066 [Trichoderma longibrachiatum]
MLRISKASWHTKGLDDLGYMRTVRSPFPTFIAMAKYAAVPLFRCPLQATKKKVFQDGDKDKEALTLMDLRANASAYIVAGSESTAMTLTFPVWSVCCHPAVKATLFEERATRSPIQTHSVPPPWTE